MIALAILLSLASAILVPKIPPGQRLCRLAEKDRKVRLDGQLKDRRDEKRPP